MSSGLIPAISLAWSLTASKDYVQIRAARMIVAIVGVAILVTSVVGGIVARA
jgi:hypothetical protein